MSTPTSASRKQSKPDFTLRAGDRRINVIIAPRPKNPLARPTRHASCSVACARLLQGTAMSRSGTRAQRQGASPVKHASSRLLYGYWNALRGSRAAPDRGDIEPGGMRRALGDSFILAFDAADDHLFRLAGTRICGLFG